MPRRARIWAAGALLLAAACAGGPALAAQAPAGPMAMAVIDRAGPGRVLVTETVSKPGGGVYALWPGAYDASVPAGLAALVRGRFTVPPGVGSAQVKYYVRMPKRGLSLSWPFPSRVGTLWLLVGRGLSLPIILNQKFYSAPSVVWDGSPYSVYSAKNVSRRLVVNLQYAKKGATPSLWQRSLPWLWVVPGALVAFALLRRLRRSAHA